MTTYQKIKQIQKLTARINEVENQRSILINALHKTTDLAQRAIDRDSLNYMEACVAKLVEQRETAREELRFMLPEPI